MTHPLPITPLASAPPRASGLADTVFSLRSLALVLVGVGLISRMAPLFDQAGRVLRQFPTEDGYLMLTIARNMALGNGMSVADGAIPTNGTQPLATGLWAVCFWLAGSSKFWGVWLVQLLEIALASLGAWLTFRLAQRVLAGRAAERLAPLAAAAWFACPVVLRHSMNCLESGVLACAVLGVLLALFVPRGAGGGAPRLMRWAGIGALLALAFWSRNDSVFLCVAVGVVHLFGWLPEDRGEHAAASWTVRAVELGVAASVVTAAALPWLLNNWMLFGSLVPISGQAESLDARFAGNLGILFISLFEYLFMFLPIPARYESHSLAVGGSTLVVVTATAALLLRSRRLSPELRGLVGVLGGFGVALALFYGLFFGAGHFMSRYLFPVSPGFALLWVAVLGEIVERSDVRRAVLHAGGVLLVVLALGLHYRVYWHGSQHQHFQVVEWVEENVPPDVWVGAVQTGTLGFFHDRTINLDGKVNPAALAARREDAVLDYVRESQIQFLVDWIGIAEWAERPALEHHFERIVNDPGLNLAVLRRRADSAPTP